MKTLQRLQLGWLLVLLLALPACVQQPRMESPADQMAVAYGTIQALANSLSVHVEAGTLKPEEAAPYLTRLEEIKSVLDLALQAWGEDKPQTGLARLQTAQKLLFALQLELTKRLEASQ